MESKHDIFQFWEVPSIARVSQWGIPAKWHFCRGQMLISHQIWDDIPKSSIKHTQVSRHKQQYCCARTGQTCQTGVALAYCMDYHIEHVWNQMVTINQ
jgi:hypothetical protein